MGCPARLIASGRRRRIALALVLEAAVGVVGWLGLAVAVQPSEAFASANANWAAGIEATLPGGCTQLVHDLREWEHRRHTLSRITHCQFMP